MDLFFRNDAMSDAIFSLRIVNDLLNRVSENSSFWKWVIIALHNSLQGFMAFAVCSTDGSTAIQDRTKDKRRVRAYMKDSETKIPKLWTFCELYERIQLDTFMCRLGGSKQFEPSKEVTESVCLLNDTRNELIHYFPNLRMSRAVHNWPPMINHCIDIIDFLCFESGTILWYENPQEQEVAKLIHDIRELTDRIEQELRQTLKDSEQ